jgi:hypothetical protein
MRPPRALAQIGVGDELFGGGSPVDIDTPL